MSAGDDSEVATVQEAPGATGAPGAHAAAEGGGTLGTFLGVYLPTVLTILGVIMFQRLGWVVGQVGLEKSLILIALANVITLVTTLSFSSVATNVRVGVGGAYNIISRSLGLEVGGAIGLPLFLSQTLSVTLYAFGLAEAIQQTIWPEAPMQWLAAGIIVAVGLLALKGAGVALKAQVPLLILILIAIAGLVFGTYTGTRVELPAGTEPPAADAGFWIAFAVFFPAVTGIMAGLGLSGDLRNPGKSLPLGSISAVLTGFAVYMVLPAVLWHAASPEMLIQEKLVWTLIAPFGLLLILPGQIGAIFSSAVGSVLGAPRTLQALALDQLAPKWLAGSAKGSDEPVVGVIVTTVLALGAVALGDLNAVAEVVSMFFLTVYGIVNFVAAIETLAGDPSWRPKLRIPWIISLVGGFACLGVMFLINPVASLIAIAVEALLWVWLRRREKKAEWGDARRGMYESLIRWSLVRLARRPMTARNWRPHVLVFANNVERRMNLVQFGAWFAAGRGVVTVCELVQGDVLEREIDPEARRMHILTCLDNENIVAFPEVDVVKDVIPGMVSVSQANGIAGLDSNTIVVGLPRSDARLADFLRVLQRLEAINRSMVLGRIRPQRNRDPKSRLQIHIWWGGRQSNGDLMLLLAYLLTRNPRWRRARISLLTIPWGDESAEAARDALQEMIQEVRIPAEPVVVQRDERPVAEIIQEESHAADVVFLGLMVPEEGEELEYAARLRQMADPLGTVFFVKNSSLFRGELV